VKKKRGAALLLKRRKPVNKEERPGISAKACSFNSQHNERRDAREKEKHLPIQEKKFWFYRATERSGRGENKKKGLVSWRKGGLGAYWLAGRYQVACKMKKKRLSPKKKEN